MLTTTCNDQYSSHVCSQPPDAASAICTPEADLDSPVV